MKVRNCFSLKILRTKKKTKTKKTESSIHGSHHICPIWMKLFQTQMPHWRFKFHGCHHFWQMKCEVISSIGNIAKASWESCDVKTDSMPNASEQKKKKRIRTAKPLEPEMPCHKLYVRKPNSRNQIHAILFYNFLSMYVVPTLLPIIFYMYMHGYVTLIFVNTQPVGSYVSTKSRIYWVKSKRNCWLNLN